MKSRLFLPLAALTCCVTAATAGDWLRNGSFENDLDAWKAPATAVTVERDLASAANGGNFLKVTVPSEKGMAVTQELSGLEPGRKYVVSARVRKCTVEDGRFIIRNLQTGKYLVWRQLAGSDDWNTLEMSFTAPPEGEGASVEFNFRSPGSCEIDDVKVAADQ